MARPQHLPAPETAPPKPQRLTTDREKAVIINCSPKPISYTDHLLAMQPNLKPKKSEPEPLEVVYSIRQNTFRIAPASILLAPPPPTVHKPDPEENPMSPTLLSPTIKPPVLRSLSLERPKSILGLNAIAISTPSLSQTKRSVTLGASWIFRTPGAAGHARSKIGNKDNGVNIADYSSPSENEEQKNQYKYHPPSVLSVPKVKQPKLTKENATMLELPANLPPLLVDGKMTIVPIPKWKRKMNFYWRKNEREKSVVYRRDLKLPGWVWRGRNFGIGNGGKKWKELWIERGY